jgi:tetratricopeptide (TPR) repeat protein
MRENQANFLNLRVICIVLLMPFLLWGCAVGRGPSTGGGSFPAPELIAPPDKSHGYSDSRTVASHTLTSKGYELLEKGDIDGALRLLERAVGINPSDGPGYYYLAEAWLAKDNLPMSARFNKLASIYLRKDRTWARRTKDQNLRIEFKRSHENTSTHLK